jgi:hypothetical protein
MGVAGTIQSAADTIGQPLAGATLAALGIRAGALGLAGVSIVAGLFCLASTAVMPSGRLRGSCADQSIPPATGR